MDQAWQNIHGGSGEWSCLPIQIEPAPAEVGRYTVSLVYLGGRKYLYGGLEREMPAYVRAIVDAMESADPYARSWARIKCDFARARL